MIFYKMSYNKMLITIYKYIKFYKIFKYMKYEYIVFLKNLNTKGNIMTIMNYK